MKVLISVSSKHGSSRGIGEAISARLATRGLTCVLRPPELVTQVTDFDLVILGSALYANRMMPAMAAFSNRWGDTLAAVPTYLFASGPLDHGPIDDIPVPKDARDLAAYVGAKDLKLFGGRMVPGQLRATERAVMRMIGARAGDFRDFTAIHAWADLIAKQARVGR